MSFASHIPLFPRSAFGVVLGLGESLARPRRRVAHRRTLLQWALPPAVAISLIIQMLIRDRAVE